MPDYEYIINDIKLTKKGRYALFFNDEFLFSVDEETLLKHHIKIDSVLSASELDSIRMDSDYYKAKDRALTYLDMRDHSESELYTKLCRNFDEMTSAEVVARIKESGLIDDTGFADKYFTELVRKGSSRTFIMHKMAEKGISREITEDLLKNAEFDDCTVIHDIIDRRFLAKINDDIGRKKVISHLVNKGFTFNDIRSAIAGFIDGHED